MDVGRLVAQVGRTVTAIAVSLLGATGVPQPRSAPGPGDAVRPSAELQRVRTAIEDVVGADGARYDAKDDRGRNLEGLKVVTSGDARIARYVGVYHHRRDETFDVALAVSDDLLRWRRVRTLQAQASQATIRRLPGRGFLLAWEQEPRNHVRVRYATDLKALLAGRFAASFDAPLTLAPTAEGTPDIRRVRFGDGPADSTIELGLHYYRDQDVDRQATATLTGFRTWRARPRPALDGALARRGLRGNFGDRDTFTLDGRRYEVVEGQRRKDDWASWRTYLLERATGTLVPLRMRVHHGQRAFGNPTASVLPGPRGGTVLFTTAFAFAEGAPRGGGSLLAYRRLRPAPADDATR